MIEHYLEQKILDKKNLLEVLFNSPVISLADLSLKTALSASQVKKYMAHLSAMFTGKLWVNIDKGLVTCQFSSVSKTVFLHAIYNQSQVLQMLTFLVTNDEAKQPLGVFTKERFLSTSAAYRTRETIVALLQEFGLGLSKTSICGEEYRIRFFIAFLQSKFGLKLCELTAKDKMVIREFLFTGSTNLRASETLSESFVFYDILLALSWKRHDKGVENPPSEMLKQLKTFFVYEDIHHCAKQIIEPRYKIRFGQRDFDYLLLIHLTAANSFAAQKWSDGHTEQLLLIFKSHPAFASLYQAVSDLLPLAPKNDDRLLKIVIFFARYFILDVQQFIPEPHYFSSDHYPGNPKVVAALRPIVTDWLGQHNRTSLNQHYFFLFCSHIEQWLRNTLAPLQVTLITSDAINDQLIREYLDNYLSSETISFSTYYSLADDIYKIKQASPDLVITHQDLIPFVKKELAQGSYVTHFDYVNPHEHLNRIQHKILCLQEEHYQQHIAQHFL
ncbi:helix-turn-helix domain-containing protein [Streptococcus iniae]|uniref:Transcriptional regulator n=1 Tax=Streptococcus iniae TaxID=1346 RepID=A0ABM5QFP9_STRIN|nr:helix-turn-helix domain-containing protein [Streptococcus iniae]AGM97983.1 RofA/Nra-like transcriptional regulator [Streptococcus iniae SF1]AHY15065.1 transcriptional regulator [Streptococcus iniae]AHY16936.1 transcriptional regulator [Streptococcus iniae]AJG25222.1 transcriptional regulator [Streptococcus iniae]APD31124.1 transcriptional regulator [Streptococcus iniae]